MENLYTSKAFLKMVGGQMHNPNPALLDPSSAISYGNHQKSPAYFSRLIGTISFFLLKNRFERGGGGAWHYPRGGQLTDRNYYIMLCKVDTIKVYKYRQGLTPSSAK